MRYSLACQRWARTTIQEDAAQAMVHFAPRSAAFRLPSRLAPAKPPTRGDGETSCPRCGQALERVFREDTRVFGALGQYRLTLSCPPCGWRRKRRIGM